MQNTQSELQQLKHYASTEQAAATATSHALQATKSQLENYHVECSALRGQLADANSRYASAAASVIVGDTATIIRGPRDRQQNISAQC